MAGIFETIVNTAGAAVIVRDEDAAIRYLLQIIEQHNVELDNFDQTVVETIQARVNYGWNS